MRGLLLFFLWATAGLCPVLALTEDRAWAGRMLNVVLVAASVMIAYGWAVRWFMRRTPAASPPSADLPPVRLAGPFMFSFVLILLAMEGVLVARVLGERGQASWLPALRQAQDSLALTLAPYLPFLQRLPADLVDMGLGDRISIVTGAFAVTYAGTAGLVLLAGGSLVRWLWRRSQVEQRLARESSEEHWRRHPVATAFSAMGGCLMIPFLLMGLLFKTDAHWERRPPKIGFKSPPELFWNFESNDIDLVYRATFGPVLLCLLVVLMVFVVWSVLGLLVRQAADEGAGSSSSPVQTERL